MSYDANTHVIAIVQARMGSVRFPGKVLSPVLGKPVLEHLIERLSRAELVDEVVLAIPDTDANEELKVFADGLGLRCFRGSEGDVLDRFGVAANSADAQVIVRITGDCPLVAPELVDRVLSELASEQYDYLRTGTSFPDGFDVEAFTVGALRRARTEATDAYDREHVTPYMQRDPVARAAVLEAAQAVPDERVTLDEPEDLEVIRAVFETFGHNRFSFEDIAQLMRSEPSLFAGNRQLNRDGGASMGTGEKLWKRAKRVIPGGNMLLSKRAEMHLPAGWPSYFSRAKGCKVWDLDDEMYVDVGLMGVGTNILGYGHPKVDEAVSAAVAAGNMSTFNCPEEVWLAEQLVDLHPWADMARFARSGGEACAVAVRIARAASGRDGVAFCGYHGWSDWYLAANLTEGSTLATHLLPGLDPAGVPQGLAGSARGFAYNDLAALESLLETGEIGVVFMEVERSAEPNPGFLDGVRAAASRHDAVLVFDECTSGFRKNLGGLHLVHNVEPDVAVFGKTLGNGYAISAVIGRESVMQAAQNTFISSTFWTERIGPAAGLASLAAMRVEDAPARIDAIGLEIRRRWVELADSAGFPIQTLGLPALGSYLIGGLNPLAVKTFVTQEMLARGYLAGTATYASVAHSSEILDGYFDTLSPVFDTLAGIESDEALLAHLPNGTAHSGFQRLA
jgi:glutamate-1-semialdehyde 2,1-aminomutase